MGKPYEKELLALHNTYRIARKVDIQTLTAVIKTHREHPFIVVGSGGSFSLAALVQQLHETVNAKLSKSVTPLQLYDLPVPIIEESVIWCVSAGGSNPDIINAFEFASTQQARQVVSVTLCPGSELDEATTLSGNTAIAFDSPAGKDGFLATNSLVFMAIVFVRAFAAAAGQTMALPEELDDLLYGTTSKAEFQSNLAAIVQRLSGRTNLITLFSPVLFPAIADFESKLAESGLGAVLPADWRNFAHGRHHWLAKRETEAAIVAFWTERDRSIAERTLKLLPDSVPVASFEVPGDYPESTLKALILVLHIVGQIGKEQGIDPGRPGVPVFGRKIYHLKYQPTLKTKGPDKGSYSAAIERKFLASSIKDREPNYNVIQSALERFVEKITSATIGGLVLDYDGTICGAANRFGSLRQDILQALTAVAEAGLQIGIATGRGKSVGVALREGLPRSIFDKFTIGYYNGGSILPLAQELSIENDPPSDELINFKNLILSELMWSEAVPIETRPCQLSILTNSLAQQSTVFRQLQHLQSVHGFVNLRLVYSTHSIDVLAPSVSKLNLVELLKQRLHTKANSVLCIGDLGMYPGNDFELLSTECSLSVDEVSYDLKSCWNLLPPQITGEDGALCYLRCLELNSSKKSARFMAESLIECRKSLRSAR